MRRAPDVVVIATGADPTALAGSLPAAEVLAGASPARARRRARLRGPPQGRGRRRDARGAGREVTLVALGPSALGALTYSTVGMLALRRLAELGVAPGRGPSPRGGRGRRGAPRAHLRRHAARARDPRGRPRLAAHPGRRARRRAAGVGDLRCAPSAMRARRVSSRTRSPTATRPGWRSDPRHAAATLSELDGDPARPGRNVRPVAVVAVLSANGEQHGTLGEPEPVPVDACLRRAGARAHPSAA